MNTYKELTVWQKSMELVTTVYAVTKNFPDAEKFGLTNQIRRSVVSIPSNIAEGYARQSDGDFLRFLKIAYGSSAELDTQLNVAKNLKFLSTEDFDILDTQLTEIRKMLNKLMSTVAASKS